MEIENEKKFWGIDRDSIDFFNSLEEMNTFKEVRLFDGGKCIIVLDNHIISMYDIDMIDSRLTEFEKTVVSIEFDKEFNELLIYCEEIDKEVD